MIQRMNRVLVLAAATLFASTAAADPPQDKPATKAEAKDHKDKDTKALLGEKKKDEGANPSDRAARRTAQHDAQKQKLTGLLKGPMDDAMRQELRHHAERMARLERIRTVAQDAKDKDAGDRVGKAIDKENARHDKWMTAHASSPGSANPGTVNAKTDSKDSNKDGGAR